MSPENLFTWMLWGCAAVAGLILLLIVSFLLLESAPALTRIAPERFVADSGWHPTEGLFNLAPMAAGTLFSTVGALCIAGPLGILSALFSRFYAPPFLATIYRSLMRLLAGIPSVVYGVWGLVILVPAIARLQPPGASLLAAVLVLALMILPTVALLTDAAIAALPTGYQESAVALGLPLSATVVHIVLPAARGSVLTALILACGRAIGETMAVLMVCGNVVEMPDSVFDPIRTLTANIALEMAYALDIHRSALFVSGLALTLMILLLIVPTTWTRDGCVRV